MTDIQMTLPQPSETGYVTYQQIRSTDDNGNPIEGRKSGNNRSVRPSAHVKDVQRIMRNHHDEGIPHAFGLAKVARGGGELYLFDGETALKAFSWMNADLMEGTPGLDGVPLSRAAAMAEGSWSEYPAQFWGFDTAEEAYAFALRWAGRTDNHGQRADTPADLNGYYEKLVEAGVITATDSGAFSELACCSISEADKVTESARIANAEEVTARAVEIRAALESGEFNYQQIADRVGVSRRTVMRHAKKLRQMEGGVTPPAGAESVTPREQRAHDTKTPDSDSGVANEPDIQPDNNGSANPGATTAKENSTGNAGGPKTGKQGKGGKRRAGEYEPPPDLGSSIESLTAALDDFSQALDKHAPDVWTATLPDAGAIEIVQAKIQDSLDSQKNAANWLELLAKHLKSKLAA